MYKQINKMKNLKIMNFFLILHLYKNDKNFLVNKKKCQENRNQCQTADMSGSVATFLDIFFLLTKNICD